MCKLFNIRCVVGEEDPQAVQGVQCLDEIQVTEDRDVRNERSIFKDSPKDIFNIVHSKAMEAKIHKDKAFLKAQEGGPGKLLED